MNQIQPRNIRDIAKEAAARHAKRTYETQKHLAYKPLLLPTLFKCPFLHRKGKLMRLFERTITTDPDTVQEWTCKLTWQPCAVIYPDLPQKSLCALESWDEDTIVSIVTA